MKKARMTKSEKQWFRAQDFRTLEGEDLQRWFYLWANKTY
jgi:hypothetical protein